MDSVCYVGLDVHKNSISVAVLHPAKGLLEWTCGGDQPAIDRLARRRSKLDAPVLCCYEAGPRGYLLQRRMAAVGVTCQVIAPSLIW